MPKRIALIRRLTTISFTFLGLAVSVTGSDGRVYTARRLIKGVQPLFGNVCKSFTVAFSFLSFVEKAVPITSVKKNCGIIITLFISIIPDIFLIL